jgi:hypothetical protein
MLSVVDVAPRVRSHGEADGDDDLAQTKDQMIFLPVTTTVVRGLRVRRTLKVALRCDASQRRCSGTLFCYEASEYPGSRRSRSRWSQSTTRRIGNGHSALRACSGTPFG